MKNHKKGFTLVEILVVVLIIGLLAAIALPQYKKAVLKSRFATLKEMTHAIYQAEQRYYLLHDSYTKNWNDLDISKGEADCSISHSSMHVLCELRYKNGGSAIQYILMTGGSRAGQTRCDAFPADPNSLTNKICQMETNRTTPNGCSDSDNFCIYYR